jgi:multidrug resistance efflux pump
MVLVGGAGVAVLAAMGWLAVRPAPAQSLSGSPQQILALTSGMVKEISVREGDVVNEGDPLLILEDGPEQRELAAARAELERIAEESQAAGIAVALPPGLGIAGKIVTTGNLKAGPPPFQPTSSGRTDNLGTLPPAEGSSGTHASPPSAKPVTPGTQRSDLEQAIAEATGHAADFRHKAEEAGAAADEALRNAAAAKGIAEQRKREAEKMRMLLSEGAVSQVETSRSEAMAASAQGAYEAAMRLAEESAKQRDDLLAQAAKADAEAAAKQKELEAWKPTPIEKPAPAPRFAPEMRPDASRQPAFVRREPSPPTPAKVTVDKKAKEMADAKLEAAKLRLDRAETALNARTVRSPKSGKVKRVLVKPGDAIRPGLVLLEFEPTAEKGKPNDARTGPSGG